MAVSFAVSCLAWTGAAQARERLIVGVSVPPQAWLVHRLAGEAAEVFVMVPPGASPATHEPTLEQRRAFERADLYLRVGHPAFPFERAWLDRLLSERTDLVVVDAVDPEDGEQMRTDEDPHVWTTPRGMREMADRLRPVLRAMLPSLRDSIQDRYGRLQAELDSLDGQLRREFAPYRGRRFFVVHAAWGRLAREYGLVQVAIDRGAKHASAGHLAGIVEEARAAGAKVIFVQPQFSPRSAELVAREVGGRVEVLDPLAADWEHNLRETVRKLVAALAQEG